MMRLLLHAVAIPLYTLVFGSAAIVLSILIPNGAPIFWLARPWARLITATCGVGVKVTGAERIPRGRACVYMSNHQSHFDVLALILALPGRYRILAKRGLFFIPVFGWALWLAGFIPVDRSRRDSAIRSIGRAAANLRKGRSILIFAEGTRSRDGSLQPLKKGGFFLALDGGAPIVPISVRGSRAVLPRGSLRIAPGAIEVVVADPVESARYTQETMEGLIDEVRRALEAGLAAGGPAPAA